MGFRVGTFLKRNATERKAQKFVQKAVLAAYGTVAPPSEWMRTNYGRNFIATIATKKSQKNASNS